jgi:hypothetical protein
LTAAETETLQHLLVWEKRQKISVIFFSEESPMNWCSPPAMKKTFSGETHMSLRLATAHEKE